MMLISIIHKGSLPDSNSTTYPMGASLSDILFSFILEKYIVCDVCGLRSPSFESSSVLYISPTDASSMQNLILQGLQQKLQKSCSRCNKNTWQVESSYILQPPKYLLLFVNRFRYINNNVTKDRCSIPMDTTVGPLKFSLQATLDHQGPSIHSGHYTASINCCKNTFYCNDHTITEFGIIDNKNLLYCICYTVWIDWHMIFELKQEDGSLIAPMALLHPLHPIDNRSRNGRRNLWVRWYVSSWWPLFLSGGSVLIYIYMYMLFYMSCFLWFTNCVLLSDDNSSIPGCLWLLAFVLNNTLILGICCSTISHLPGCFCPWTFSQNIGLNMVPSDPFMSHLATQLGYSAGEFQALQLIVLATFGVVD